MLINCVWVGAGGALGAVARYLISLLPLSGNFPVKTLVTNLLGAILIGVVAGLATKNRDISPQTVLFLKTGLCGGFTTFSTFSVETLHLLEGEHAVLGALYAAASVVLCVLGVWLGNRLAA